MPHAQRGMTLIELVVVLSIIGLMVAILMPLMHEPIRNAKITGGITEAKKVVAACNLVRVKPLTSTRHPDTQAVRHTYVGPYTTWTNVSVLTPHLDPNYGMPVTNPFGLPYMFKMREHTCSVALDVDEVIDGWAGQQTEMLGDKTRFIIGTPPASKTTPQWVKHQNRFLSGEVVR